MLYLVAATLNPGVHLDEVQGLLNHGHSWFRFSATSWVVCTNEVALVWSNRLAPVVRPHGTVLICRLDVTDRFGWMTQEFWGWFDQHAGHL